MRILKRGCGWSAAFIIPTLTIGIPAVQGQDRLLSPLEDAGQGLDQLRGKGTGLFKVRAPVNHLELKL